MKKVFRGPLHVHGQVCTKVLHSVTYSPYSSFGQLSLRPRSVPGPGYTQHRGRHEEQTPVRRFPNPMSPQQLHP